MNVKPKRKNNSPINIVLAVIAAAAVCLLFVILCIYLSGTRYIKYKTNGGGTVKYFGKVDSSNEPISGKLYYSNGITAQIVDSDPVVIKYSNGDVYQGGLEKLGRSGKGILTFKNGDVYTGQFENNTLNGQGQMHFANGDIYEGEFKDGKKEGTGTYKWKRGIDEESNPVYDIYVGEFKNDKKNGKGIYTWNDGSYYDGTFVDDIREGSDCKCVFSSGDIYIGDFKNDVRTGNGTYTWANGEEYTGEFSNNNLHGEGTYRWPSGREYHGYFENGVIVRATETEGIVSTTDVQTPEGTA